MSEVRKQYRKNIRRRLNEVTSGPSKRTAAAKTSSVLSKARQFPKGKINFTHLLVTANGMFHMSAPLTSERNDGTFYEAYCSPFEEKGCYVCGKEFPFVCGATCSTVKEHVRKHRSITSIVFQKTNNQIQIFMFVSLYASSMSSDGKKFHQVFRPLKQ